MCMRTGRPINDLTGERFGAWTVESRAPNRKGQPYWNCRCDCGNTGTVAGCSLKHGDSKSCGCFKASLVGDLSPNWHNGESYGAVHDWARDNIQKPDNCQIYSKRTDFLDLHNIDETYKRKLEDWIYLCRACHKRVHRLLKKHQKRR